MALIALDLDGTLVNQASAARAWAATFADDWRLAPIEVDVVATALAARRPKGEVFRLLVGRLGLPVSAEEVWRDYRSAMPSLVTVTNADRRALVDLRADGWTLGIVTNGMADNQEGKIRHTGLDSLVDGWVVSDTGSRPSHSGRPVGRTRSRRLAAQLQSSEYPEHSFHIHTRASACTTPGPRPPICVPRPPQAVGRSGPRPPPIP